jgi:hypothetical protein
LRAASISLPKCQNAKCQNANIGERKEEEREGREEIRTNPNKYEERSREKVMVHDVQAIGREIKIKTARSAESVEGNDCCGRTDEQRKQER